MTNWNLDLSHSELVFKTRHMMIATVSGEFKQFNVNLTTEGEDFTTSKVVVEVETGSVSTGSDQRDGHLKSADFFDSENHPTMTFTSASISKVDDENYTLHGELNIRGIVKPVQLDVALGGIGKDPWGAERVGFSFTGKIKRSDWNLVWNVPLEGSGLLVSDEVKMLGEVQFIKGA